MIGSPLEALGGAAIAIPVSLLLLSVLIIIHEAGHYLAARRMGIEVLEFGLGYPPRVIGRKWRGTLFSLNAIPFGGFARMLGEARDTGEPGSFSSKSLRARAFVMISGPLMNLLFAGIVLWNMYGKKQNPHQSYEDRNKQIKSILKSFLFISILATVFVLISVVLSALEMRHFMPIAMSLYLQTIALACIQSYVIDYTNFDVYREDPIAT